MGFFQSVLRFFHFFHRALTMVTRTDFRPRKTLDLHGDDTARDVFASVGYALSQWEHVEEMFASLFAFLCGPTKATHASFRAYGTLTATAARSKMIDAAAEVFFSKFPDATFKKRLADILLVYGDAGARRNEIAHGIVMGPALHKIENNVAIPLPTKWYLFPALHSTKKQSLDLRSEYRFNSGTIDTFAKAFDGLNADITAYKSDLIGFYQSFPETERAQY